MSFITNIRSVAKYESKILLRSWFFRIFTILAALFLGAFNGVLLLSGDGGAVWPIKSISSNIPYFSLLLLNTGQAVVAIFLASDFLKRDKKLDTSEVFYVHPLSNAEYVFGKIWGNLRAFLVLNLIIMAIIMIFNIIAPGVSVDVPAYILYFLLICIPTLVFIIGFSIFLMLILKNQAVTFVILLGYIALTVFYIGNKFYYLFDYMAYSLPMLKSSIVGFSNYAVLINHRAIYLFAGLAFVCFTISLFNRLPNSSRSSYPWIALGVCFILLSGSCGFNHINSILQAGKNRKMYTSINNNYAKTPRMAVEDYTIEVEQKPNEIVANVQMEAIALTSSSQFAFCLNPGFRILEVTSQDNPLKFIRDHQIILVDFGREIVQNDTVPLTIKYEGRADENFCYLDISAEVLQEEYRQLLLNVDKKYLFQTPDYVLFTPESYWYPRPGISYSDEHPDWQQVYFSQFNLQIKPLPGLTAITQGKQTSEEEGLFSFTTDDRIQSVSLIIGNYREVKAEADSVQFSIRYLDGHGYFTAKFDSIVDTIPSLLTNVKQQFERNYKLRYPFKRFSVVEVPAQFHSYPRAWSQAQEAMQPEMTLLTEKGWSIRQLDVEQRIKDHIRWSKWNGAEIDANEACIRTANDFFYLFFQTELDYNFSSAGRGQMELTSKANPYFFFPQVYNFKYNVFSPQWPVSNRLVELYLQNKSDNSGWERQINGISNNEKANLLFKEYSFQELQSNIKHRSILDNMISLQGRQLFAEAEMNLGVMAFRDSIYAILGRNAFQNLPFEAMLDTLGRISNTNIAPSVEKWNSPMPLPYYAINSPEVIQISNRGKDTFVLKFRITNDSEYDGIVNVVTRMERWWSMPPDPSLNKNMRIPAGQTLEIVSVLENQPQEIVLNTIIAENLPCFVTIPIRNIRRENGRVPDTPGYFIVTGSSSQGREEIIVDNEDPLFSISEPSVTGILPKLLDKVDDSSFKYSGIWWWSAPLEWTLTTNEGFYGKYVRSAYVIRGGDGSKTATWKVPVPEPGHYEIYCWPFNEQMRYNRNHLEGEYHYKIEYSGEVEDAYVNLKHASEEWEQLGTYYIDSDTVTIVLANDSKLRAITADAVRLVRR